MRLVSVNLGDVNASPAKGGTKAFGKAQVSDAVLVTGSGLQGDHYADKDTDDGSEKAVYLLSKTDLDWWSDEVGRALSPGALAENLTYDGPSTPELAIGDRFHFGQVLLEVTAPRTPCGALVSAMGKTAAKKMRTSGRSGVFARVLQRGVLKAGDRGRFVPFQRPRIPVSAIYDLISDRLPDGVTRRELLSTPLHAELRRMLTDKETPLPDTWNWP